MEMDACRIIEMAAKEVFRDDVPHDYLDTVKAERRIVNSEELISIGLKVGNGMPVDFDKYVSFVERSIGESSLAPDTKVRVALHPYADPKPDEGVFFLVYFIFHACAH